MTASPIMKLFREWEAKYAKAGDQIATNDDQSDVLLDQCREIERQMMLLPISDTADFAAKLIVSTSYGDFMLPDRGEGGLLDEAEAILAVREHPDAKLIELGEQYRTARQAEIALYREIGDDESPETMERVDKCSFEMGRLSDAILAIEPKTIDGLRVVAQAWGSCHWPPEDPCTDTRAVRSVMRWLIGEAQS